MQANVIRSQDDFGAMLVRMSIKDVRDDAANLTESERSAYKALLESIAARKTTHLKSQLAQIGIAANKVDAYVELAIKDMVGS